MYSFLLSAPTQYFRRRRLWLKNGNSQFPSSIQEAPPQPKPEEKNPEQQIARVCGNCQFSTFFSLTSKTLSRLRLPCKKLLESETLFWTELTVQAVQEIAKVAGFKAHCKKEGAQVSMLEKTCACFVRKPRGALRRENHSAF